MYVGGLGSVFDLLVFDWLSLDLTVVSENLVLLFEMVFHGLS